MPKYRVKADINGVVRRSWGDSDTADNSRKHAQAQLDRLYGRGVAKIVSVEEIEPEVAVAECMIAELFNIPTDHVPKK